MSNSLAIATVTATLQRLLQTAMAEDFPKAKITIVRPEASGNNTPKLGINLYLYHVSPNLAWQNSDLRARQDCLHRGLDRVSMAYQNLVVQLANIHPHIACLD